MSNEIQAILEKYPNAKRDALIPILQDVQDKQGYISRDAVQIIGKHLDLPSSKIYGVATFYNQFRFSPLGKYHIQICRGTACHVRGSLKVLEAFQRELKIKAGETTRDNLFSLEVVSCIGACGLAPAISISGEVHAAVKPEDAKKIIQSYRKLAQSEGDVNE